MNHYFSRLAQRSSIAAPNPGRQPQAANAPAQQPGSANAATTNRATNYENNIDALGKNNWSENNWGEQHTEINSAVYHAAAQPEKSDQATRIAVNQNPIDQSAIAPAVNTQIASTTLTNIGINSMQATATGLRSGLTQSQLFSAGVHSDAVDTLTNESTNSLPAISYSEHQNAPSLPALSPAKKSVMTQQRESDNFSGVTIFTEQRQHIPASAEPHRKTIVIESVQRYDNTMAMDNGNTPGFYDRSVIEENKKTTARPDGEVQSASMVASTNRAGRAASNSVAAIPHEMPTAFINMPDATLRAGVQVNIGKIELEIFAPQKKVVHASPPAAPVVKSAQREPVFNPHRYYLRSR